ncbi:hypothetical protein C1646_765767 [Rhizophagus diaphanus]|nr:hypothetical protein C1646_765767 [Rhizophagus diaphanus] [Rhizophagus sp. MUCL 43196]
MKKLRILIFLTFIILLQFIYEVNTQAPKGVPIPGDAPLPPSGGDSAIPPSTKTNTLTTLTSTSGSRASLVNSSNLTEGVISTTDIINNSIIGGIVSNLILIFVIGLCFFLVRIYKNIKENSEAIATPGLSNHENKNINNTGITNNDIYNFKLLPILPTPIEIIISNQEQETNSSDHNNQQETLRNNPIEKIENESFQITRQEMTQSVGRDPSRKLSFIIDKNIIEQMKQDILQDIKQELTKNIKSKVMTSFVIDNNFEESSSSSSRNYI